jgi:hypothetical protein
MHPAGGVIMLPAWCTSEALPSEAAEASAALFCLENLSAAVRLLGRIRDDHASTERGEESTLAPGPVAAGDRNGDDSSLGCRTNLAATPSRQGLGSHNSAPRKSSGHSRGGRVS